VHLHFEVHRVISTDQIPTNSAYDASRFLCPPEVDPTRKLACIPVDPYGWDGPAEDSNGNAGDPYTRYTGVENVRLWNHLPLTFGISPDTVKAGAATVTVVGDGFVPGSKVVAVDGKTNKEVTAVSAISSINQATVTFTWGSAPYLYYLYVVTPDGRRSNFQKLTVTGMPVGNR